MTCQHIQALLERYVDNELTDKERIQLEQHIADCDVCSQELLVLQRLQRIGDSFQIPEPPATYWNELQSNIAQKISEERPYTVLRISLLDRILSILWPQPWSFRLVGLAATAVVLFMIVKLTVLKDGKLQMPAVVQTDAEKYSLPAAPDISLQDSNKDKLSESRKRYSALASSQEKEGTHSEILNDQIKKKSDALLETEERLQQQKQKSQPSLNRIPKEIVQSNTSTVSTARGLVDADNADESEIAENEPLNKVATSVARGNGNAQVAEVPAKESVKKEEIVIVPSVSNQHPVPSLPIDAEKQTKTLSGISSNDKKHTSSQALGHSVNAQAVSEEKANLNGDADRLMNAEKVVDYSSSNIEHQIDRTESNLKTVQDSAERINLLVELNRLYTMRAQKSRTLANIQSAIEFSATYDSLIRSTSDYPAWKANYDSLVVWQKQLQDNE